MNGVRNLMTGQLERPCYSTCFNWNALAKVHLFHAFTRSVTIFDYCLGVQRVQYAIKFPSYKTNLKTKLVAAISGGFRYSVEVGAVTGQNGSGQNDSGQNDWNKMIRKK